MHLVPLLLNAGGRLGRGCFIAAAVVLYATGLAAHLLTAPAVLATAGLWPFAFAQALLTWIWFALHAKRLRDSSRGIAPAQGIAAIHVLAIGLLMLVGAFLLENGARENSASASIAALRELFSFSRGWSDPLTLLGLLGCASLLIAPIFSLWAAVQPSRAVGPP